MDKAVIPAPDTHQQPSAAGGAGRKEQTEHETPRNILRLRRFARGIGLFWQGITYVFLLICAFAAFASQPVVLSQPRGWLMLALCVAMGAWYFFGFNWMLRPVGEKHWRDLTEPRLSPNAWRGFVFWAVTFALTLALTALDHTFAWLIWIVYGVSFSVWPLPYGLALFIPTAATIFYTQGWLPTNVSPNTLFQFVVGVAVFCIYTATAYLPFVLLRGRFERERIFNDLEASHRELAEAHRQLEESSMRDRELARLRERGRIAREMHDTLGHSLALIAVKLDAAQRLRGIDAPRADAEIAATQTIARSALSDLRATLADLKTAHPQQEVPLGETLARAAREAGARAGWQVTYDISPDLPELNDQTYAALLRVGQEAIANSERHAHARNVRLALTRVGCEIVLQLQDDGVGVLTTNPPQRTPARVGVPTEADAPDIVHSPAGHYGITVMRERMEEIGGRFTIGSASGAAHGTLVEARVSVAGL